ncbi:hypothetical protein GGX14DRAFT_657353 [Mycena pura]|uniref:Fungal-type protein kinase domain-containing protein n=1 Tax=Mycena pura TaxID=153505 RepID=A0AAD6YLL6_9AGAR|nr:hypothetical protein GGX14DRAFT_657353 [Mycena pura]
MSLPSQSLESLFYVCSNHNGDTRSITFPREASGAEDRILGIANSLAFICVTGSRGKGEVYATAIRTEGSDSAVIYLAENDGVSDSTVKYLRSVLAQLTAISRSQPDGRDRSLDLDEVILPAKEQELGTTILRHTFPKFLNSLTKRDAVWDTRVAAIRDQLAESPDELKFFALIERTLSAIYKAAILHKAHTDDTTLKALYESISMLEGFIRRGTSSDKLSVLLQKLDRTAVYPWSDNSDFVDNDLELDVDVNNALRTAFSMTRFINRIIAVNIHIRRLLRLAVSHTYKSLFAKEISIHCCPRAEISVYVEPAALTDHLQLDGLLSRHDLGETVTGPLHAELSVFTALLRDFFEGRSAPYWAIGASKPMINNSEESKKALVQLAKSARSLLMASRGCFVFVVAIRSSNARILCFDRSGFRASSAFDWTKQPDIFAKFFYGLYSPGVPGTIHGDDPSISIPSQADKEAMHKMLTANHLYKEWKIEHLAGYISVLLQAK